MTTDELRDLFRDMRRGNADALWVGAFVVLNLVIWGLLLTAAVWRAMP